MDIAVIPCCHWVTLQKFFAPASVLEHRACVLRQHGTQEVDAMIRLGPQIRLTRKIQQLHWLTDIEPVGIRTLADLEAYVAKCKALLGCVRGHPVPPLGHRPGGRAAWPPEGGFGGRRAP